MRKQRNIARLSITTLALASLMSSVALMPMRLAHAQTGIRATVTNSLSSALRANGKIAFARSLSISEIHVMNGDGSNQMSLTNGQGFDGLPVWSPDGSRIAFASGRDGNVEIYAINADGSSPMRLTNDPAEDLEPTWSPDGSRIAFTRNLSIYVMNADGSNLTQLTNGQWWSNNPVWSPDGARIAFTSGRPEPDDGIYVMNADGSNQTRLTNSFGFNSHPAWSPDGARIAFASTRDDKYNFEIYVMNADGSNPTRLTNSPTFDGEPAWSPDNTKIAFTSYRDSNIEIYVMNVDGSNQTRVTNNPAGDGSPHWSPDGGRIVFAIYQSLNAEIYVMNADGGSLLNLTNHPARDYAPAWSPDGARIAFTSERDGNAEIYVMNADGSSQTRVTSDPVGDFDPDWSPDGSRIVFTRNSSMYVMNADGSNQVRISQGGNYGDAYPAWSPDGTRIAFMRDGGICTMNTSGGNLTCPTTATLLEAANEPAWSPDGTRITYTANPILNDEWGAADEIVVMNAGGGNKANLTNTPGVQDAQSAWSPDGAKIAFTSLRDSNSGEIYVMNADGGNPTRLTNNLDAGNSQPDWQPFPSTTPNPVDDAQFFVRQHYLDFLNREPDASGFVFWTNEIISCGADQACIESKQVNVSAAFFLSIEFQQTGYLVYRIYKSSYSNLPGMPVPIRLNEFLPDTQAIGQGVIVNQTGWEQVLENNKQAFTSDFVQRSRFTSAFPTSMTPTEFVDKLFANAGLTSSGADYLAALNEFGSATNTADVAARSRALRRVAENSTFAQQEFNRAFVLMQYFGYLRRNPNDPPEPTLDFQGYNFWLNKLNQFNGDFVGAEMVKAFLVSTEYRQRFGQP